MICCICVVPSYRRSSVKRASAQSWMERDVSSTRTSGGTRSEAIATSSAFIVRTWLGAGPEGAASGVAGRSARGVLSRMTMVSAGVSERRSSSV